MLRRTLKSSFATAAFPVVSLLTIACGGDGDPSSDGGGTGGGTAGTAGSSGAGATSGAGGAGGSAGTAGSTGLPSGLPFDFSRPAAGTAPTAAEIDAFTQKITGFWKQIDYFRWVTWHSHGLHASFDPSMPDYSMWWQDTRATKSGDTITFVHQGGADNIMIRTPKVLTQAVYGYLASGDPLMKEIVIGYSKGIVSLFQGMHWGNEQPDEFITARAIFTHNHSYTTTDGRNVAVDYSPMYGMACSTHDECPGTEHTLCPVDKQIGFSATNSGQWCCQYGACSRFDWNAHTIPNDSNPNFGSIWLRNMRSKDDVPHLFRIYPVLLRVVQDAPDADVREAAQTAADFLSGFGADIVDHDYMIRTKEDGEAFVPSQDLADFTRYDAIAPDGECNAKVSAALMSKGNLFDNDCGDGVEDVYESISSSLNFFNYAIIRYFHIAAITNALIQRENAFAEAMLAGLAVRADAMMADDAERMDNSEWDADAAATLLAAGASGLPLTGAEATLVQREYSDAVDFYAPWPNWDLWDSSIPDGDYEYKPSRNDGTRQYIRPEELTYLIEYCASPWKNATGVDVVNCDIVLDPSRWGE